MSFTTVNPPHDEAPPAMHPTTMAPVEPPTKPSYKSYRKKYLKMRQRCKEMMRESNSTFEDGQRATRIAERIQEQNDQLLDLLLDYNISARIPASLRYSLSPTPSPSAVPSLEPDEPDAPSTLEKARAAHADLERVRHQLSCGDISPARFEEIFAELRPFIDSTTSLSSLEARIPHTTLESIASITLPPDFSPTESLTYYTPAHESIHAANLDHVLASADPDAAFAALKRGQQPSVKDMHKETLLNNPSSAYNWLRNHQPTLFTDHRTTEHGQADQERKAAKPSPKPNTSHPRGGGGEGKGLGVRGGDGVGKRERVSAIQSRPQPEMLDDEGNVISGGLDGAGAGAGTGRAGKRKRGEDDAYRPKGGSSRPGKRKRAGTGGGGGGKGGRASGNIGRGGVGAIATEEE
ncbi:MAG: hypothetical protein Q9183_003274 [Haloplaca sp. 2 TL-2023]